MPAKNQYVPLTSKQEQILDGLLLGDACVASRRKRNARVQYSCKELDLAQFVAAQFPRHGFRDPYPRPCYTEDWRAECEMYDTYSSANPVFTEQRNRWYPDGEKRPPEDLVITDVTGLFWYLGDGGLCHSHGRYSRANFSTHGFRLGDISSVIIPSLNRAGFRSAIAYPDGKGHRIYLNRWDTFNWIDFIGGCPVLGLQRKWKVLNAG